MKRKKLTTNQIKQRLVISSLVLALVIIGSYFIGGIIGKAIETPTPEAINLDLLGEETINYVTIGSINFSLTLSNGSVPSAFTVKLTPPDEEEMIKYKVVQTCEGLDCGFDGGMAGSPDYPYSFGLLDSSHISTDKIYLDNDDDADLKITLEEGYLKLTNLNYQSPEPADFELYDSNMNKQISEFLFFALDDEKEYFFNVTSEFATPVLSATMDGLPLSPEEFSTTVSGEGFATGKLKWSTDQSGSHILDVTATVGAETTTERYFIALGGIIYALDEENFPFMTIKKNDDNEFVVRYLFKATTEYQSFSLPCRLAGDEGVADIIGKTNEEFIEKILTHDPGQGVEQWTPMEGVPDDFDSLEPNKGYILKLNEAQPVEFSAVCQEDDEFLPPSADSILYSLPNLDVGWNLVGIGGYESVPVSDLEPKVPPFKSIGSITLVKQDLDHEVDVQEMEPGKVYWVYVE